MCVMGHAPTPPRHPNREEGQPHYECRGNCPSSQPITHTIRVPCGRAQASREPLPGGYTLGEQIYFTGACKRFEDGDRLEHGKQGEVVGPAVSQSCG